MGRVTPISAILTQVSSIAEKPVDFNIETGSVFSYKVDSKPFIYTSNAKIRVVISRNQKSIFVRIQDKANGFQHDIFAPINNCEFNEKYMTLRAGNSSLIIRFEEHTQLRTTLKDLKHFLGVLDYDGRVKASFNWKANGIPMHEAKDATVTIKYSKKTNEITFIIGEGTMNYGYFFSASVCIVTETEMLANDGKNILYIKA